VCRERERARVNERSELNNLFYYRKERKRYANLHMLQHEVFGKWEKNAFSTVLPLASFDGHTETKLY